MPYQYLYNFFRIIRWPALVGLIWMLDQLTKWMILHQFSYGEIRIITPFLNLTFITNSGAAFGFLSNASGWQRWVLAAIAVIAIIWMGYFLKKYRHQRLFCLALSCILGGALGNLLDRLRYGYVIDFIDFYVKNWHWPAFNLADSSITLGVALLILNEIKQSRSKVDL